MYFCNTKSILVPLHKAHKRGISASKWQQAYQSIKHYRSKSVGVATIENFLNALGALYVLNLYYANESFWLGTPIEGRRNYTVDSRLFTPILIEANPSSPYPAPHIIPQADQHISRPSRKRCFSALTYIGLPEFFVSS